LKQFGVEYNEILISIDGAAHPDGGLPSNTFNADIHHSPLELPPDEDAANHSNRIIHCPG
jgi:hypothetical protein